MPASKFSVRLTAAVLMFAAAVSVDRPAHALDPADARHLLARTGFGIADADAIAGLNGLDRRAAVDKLLASVRSEPVTAPPTWSGDHVPTEAERKSWTPEDKRAFNKRNRERLRELRQWWVREMLATPSPLTEQMVLFWHNHFTSSFEAVKWVPYLYAQNARFRRHSLGDFKVLLSEMITDPAMLFYLDGRRNLAKKPNENFARELLELFTLGEGNGYSEADVAAAARALTGWTVDPLTSQAKLLAKHHDDGEKTFLGRRGRLGADDIVAIILDQPATARHIATKFHAAFIGGTPNAKTMADATEAFRRSGYQLHPLLRTLLLSDAFWSPKNRGTLVKSPVDLVVGSARFAGYRDDTKTLVGRMNAMGQQLFRPPNVKGWPGGTQWITSTTLVARNGFTQFLTKALRRRGEAMLADPNMDMPGATPAVVMLATAPVRPVPADQAWSMTTLAALLIDPVFQMK
jgi:uncharacterized protein (DUF1800 family)